MTWFQTNKNSDPDGSGNPELKKLPNADMDPAYRFTKRDTWTS